MKKRTNLTKKKYTKSNARRFSDSDEISEKLQRIIQQDFELSDQQMSDLSFHMTDWMDDLHALYDLYSCSAWKKRSAKKIVTNFLAHVPYHLNKANNILFGDD